MEPITDPSSELPRLGMANQVLIVGQDPGSPAAEATRGELLRLLTDQGCAVTLVRAGEGALEAAGREAYLFILLHVEGDADLAILRSLRQRVPSVRAVIFAANPTLESAVESLRLGAFDYLQEPISPARLEAVIHRARLEGDPRQREFLLSLQALTPGLVHELRNPLSGILAISQMLAGLVGGNQRACEYVEILREEGQEIERLLTRLAEFGRLPAGGFHLTGRLDLRSLLGRMVDERRPSCQTQGIRLVSRFDPRGSRVRGDPARLSQACAEIVKNAIEAMPNGGTLTVTAHRVPGVSRQSVNGSMGQLEEAGGCESHQLACRSSDTLTDCSSEGGWVQVEFADTGTGMTEEVRRRALEPFFSTRPRALGIGLSLAQAILLAHGGGIRLDSCPGGGTQVLLTLPVTRD